MLRRIISGFVANGFGQAVTIFIQIFSLPIFLFYWDMATYGWWILLSTLPAFLSMADVGLVQTAGNKMTMAMGRGDVPEANRIFHSALVFMLLVCGVLGGLLTPVALWGPLPDYVTDDKRIALVAILGSVLVTFFLALAEWLFKSTGRYATGTVLSDSARLAEWGGNIGGVILFRTFAGVAVCGFLARLAVTGIGVWLSRRDSRGLTWGTKLAQKSEIMTMIRPAMFFLAFPLSNALSFQGVTLVVGSLLGTASVTLFASYRTIARVAVQLTGMFSHALWPEFGRLFGHGGAQAIEKLYRHCALLGAFQALALSAVLYFAAPWLLRIWTHGKIGFVPVLMMWMLAYAAIGGIWHVPRTLLLSTNQHIGLAGWSLAASALSVSLAYVLGQTWQVEGIAAAMLTSECFIALVSVYLAHRLFHPTPSVKGYVSEGVESMTNRLDLAKIFAVAIAIGIVFYYLAHRTA
ncbi:MAG TPA: hypothetical protein VL996_13905 [Methylocella sp.]|nr:hypothetical protein [Methylocella sp.]